MITSRTNEKVKEVCELVRSAAARKRAGVYVVEGPRMVREIPEAMRVAVFASESFLGKCAATPEFAVAAGLAAAPEFAGVQPTSDDVFAKMSATNSPQGILAICKMPTYNIEEILGEQANLNQQANPNQQANQQTGSAPLLILEGIQDPGNLGTMFRSAEAAGAKGIIMDETCADPFSPKTIRSTMGSIFRVPFIRNQEFFENIKKIKSAGYTLYAAHLGGEVLGFFKPAEKSAFLIGNEGNGLTEPLSGLSDARIRIPMEGQVESLNASVAASLLLYEWHRSYR